MEAVLVPLRKGKRGSEVVLQADELAARGDGRLVRERERDVGTETRSET